MLLKLDLAVCGWAPPCYSPNWKYLKHGKSAKNLNFDQHNWTLYLCLKCLKIYNAPTKNPILGQKIVKLIIIKWAYIAVVYSARSYRAQTQPTISTEIIKTWQDIHSMIHKKQPFSNNTSNFFIGYYGEYTLCILVAPFVFSGKPLYYIPSLIL